MEIIKATLEDIEDMMVVYKQAKAFMKENNNPQWPEDYPSKEWIIEDINHMYLCKEDKNIACVFYFAIEEDEDYQDLKGSWLNDEPYGVVHRVASSMIVKGAAKYCLDWAFQQIPNIRIDTHPANIPMQNLLKKCGFQLCGTFERIDMEWLAYQKTEEA